jgi:phosphoribosylformylglycinamidine cyclo-ligase
MTDRDKAYKEAGVDIEAGNRFVSRIKGMAAGTFIKGVMSDIGGFGGMFRLDTSQYSEPVLVASTDGVGTKLKLAFEFDRHRTIGIDLVAMSVNDIIVQGARPLFFLDYFATGKLDLGQGEQVLEGIVAGCREAGCALLGGETAEMPDFYGPGEYDLSGFCVGVVDRSKIIDGSAGAAGDKIIGIGSSGVHSNGYSLVRRIYSRSGLRPEETFPGATESVADVLLQPTKIYVGLVLNLLQDLRIKGMVHITGGGFYDNIPRVLGPSVKARVRFGSWVVPPVFAWLKASNSMAWPEMLQIFNCGVGFMLIVGEGQVEEVLSRARAFNHQAWVIGDLVERTGDTPQVEILF